MLNYDRNGGLEHDGVRSYRYNALSQLVEVTSRDTRVTMAYDVRERCVLRRFYHKGAQAQWQEDLVKGRLLTYSNWDLIHESHLNSGLHDSYYHGASTNEVMAALFGAEKKPSNLLFPIYDGIGSTVAVVTGTGVVSKRFRYNVFGQPSTTLVGARTQSEEADFRFLFTGSQWVPEINQYYNRHRYYNPELGRWLTFDPIQFKSGDFNSLRYANNDSINSTDPYGLACDPASLQACRDACQFGLEVCCVAGTLVCIGSGPGYIACLVGFCGICGFDYSICMLGCRFGWW
jgi:RHS repeat-associated protein